MTTQAIKVNAVPAMAQAEMIMAVTTMPTVPVTGTTMATVADRAAIKISVPVTETVLAPAKIAITAIKVPGVRAATGDRLAFLAYPDFCSALVVVNLTC